MLGMIPLPDPDVIDEQVNRKLHAVGRRTHFPADREVEDHEHRDPGTETPVAHLCGFYGDVLHAIFIEREGPGLWLPPHSPDVPIIVRRDVRELREHAAVGVIGSMDRRLHGRTAVILQYVHFAARWPSYLPEVGTQCPPCWPQPALDIELDPGLEGAMICAEIAGGL